MLWAGIATRYGPESLEIESRWGEIFRTYPEWPWGPPNLLFHGYRAFRVGKGGRGMTLNTHPHLILRS